MKMKILAVVILTLAVAAEAGAEDSLKKIFNSLFKTFGRDSKTKIRITAGPKAVKMNRGGVAGKQWIAKSGKYTFKLTIEDETGLTLKQLLQRVQKLPPAYMRGCQVVSDEGEDGIAMYVTLGGAGGHGGKTYINLVSGAGALTMAHEMGHSLEQVARESDPEILNTWDKISKEDKISVSGYGDSACSEDIAEFALVYAVCLDEGSEALTELKKLSPRRFALWEKVLRDPVPD